MAAMRVRLTFSNEMKQVIQAAKVEFERTCAFYDCAKTFYSDWPTADYCCVECQAKAKYRRWQAKSQDD
jgi:hypothetical protein